MNSRACVLALDAGTGSGRAAIFTLDGALIAVADRQWSFTTPPSLDPFGKEFDAGAFLDMLADATHEALDRAGRCEIRAVATTGLRGGSVLIDRAGQVVAASPIQDVRGILVVGDVDGAVPDLFRRTGHTPTWLFPLARLAWYRSEEPDVFARVATLLAIDEWLSFALSGERRATPAGAGDSMCLDVAARTWDDEIFASLDLPRSLVPPIVNAGEIVGGLTSPAAHRFRLPAGIPVVACAGDTQAALLGSGVVDAGAVGVVAGTTAPVMAVTASAVWDPEGSLWTGCHPIPSRWVIEGNSGRAGSSYEWILDLLGLHGAHRFADAEQLAGSAPPGSNRSFAFLGAEPVDLSKLNPSRPAGFLFPAPELGIPVGRAELLRASLENVAFAIEANLRRIETATPLGTGGLAMTGGLSASDLFARIVANVTRRPVRRGGHPQGAALGCAACAAVGAGEYGDLTESVSAMVRTEIVREPDPATSDVYRDSFEQWHERWRTLQSIT
ncbi:MAG: FGGY-family carbohydrate kinase [Deltaproteobacteria bacterium]|nr:FGGY-family carbohydrate kinase [Deltaproteobacteria bacterium]